MASEKSKKLVSKHAVDATASSDDETRIESVSRHHPSQGWDLSTSPPRSQLQIGDLLKDRFQIVDKLGEGGMGMVFKAIDLRKVEAKSHNPYIAIKVLHPALAQNETLVAGLQRECEKAQRLSHPNIITVFDFDRDGDYVFMSMEFLSGRALNKIISESASAGGIDLQHAWPIILQMGKALAYAHRKGIVHSDFKPANVFVTDEQDVKVLDFGIAVKTDSTNNPDATVFNARAEGALTPPYASFEMLNGALADLRDDVYAFGLVVYEMLTGRHPYNRKPASLVFIEQQRADSKFVLAPINKLSGRQWQLIKSAIELLQDKRPKSLDDWLEEFKPQLRLRSAKWLGGIAIAVLALLGGFIAKNWSGRGREPTQQQIEWQQTEPTSRSFDAQQSGEEQLAASTPTIAQPVVFESPVALSGDDQQGLVGQTVQLNGSASRSGDGQALSYAWQLVRAPIGSNAALQNAESATPQLTPDKAGEYQIELTVRDAHNRSAPVITRLMITEAVKPSLSHQAISSDGILKLAASKPQYRIGEKLKLNLHVARSGYLRVAYVGAAGEVSEILPNQNQNSKVKADSKLQIPPKGAKFNLEVTGPVGMDKIVAVFSESPINNLENLVDHNGDMAREYLQNSSKVVIQYAVVK